VFVKDEMALNAVPEQVQIQVLVHSVLAPMLRRPDMDTLSTHISIQEAVSRKPLLITPIEGPKWIADILPPCPVFQPMAVRIHYLGGTALNAADQGRDPVDER